MYSQVIPNQAKQFSEWKRVAALEASNVTHHKSRFYNYGNNLQCPHQKQH